MDKTVVIVLVIAVVIILAVVMMNNKQATTPPPIVQQPESNFWSSLTAIATIWGAAKNPPKPTPTKSGKRLINTEDYENQQNYAATNGFDYLREQIENDSSDTMEFNTL